MPRLVYLLGVGIGLVAVAFALTCQILGPAPGVTEANAKRIQKGMALPEVEALLGGAAKRTKEWSGTLSPTGASTSSGIGSGARRLARARWAGMTALWRRTSTPTRRMTPAASTTSFPGRAGDLSQGGPHVETDVPAGHRHRPGGHRVRGDVPAAGAGARRH